MVSRCRIDTRAESGVTDGQPRSSGTYSSAGSSSLSTPSSRSARIADAVKLLVIEAIRNTVSASGARPADVPLAEPGRVHEFAAQHDPVGQPGLAAALLIARRQPVHIREIDHRPSLPESSLAIPAAPGAHAIIDHVRVRREGDTRHGGW